MRLIINYLAMALILLALAGCQPEATPTALALPPTNTAAAASPTPAAPTATLPPTPTPTPLPPQAKVLEVLNLVQAHDIPGVDWAPARVDMPLYSGGEVWAKEESSSLLSLLTDANLMRVAPNTIFSLSQPQETSLTIHLQEGQIWLNVNDLPEGGEMEVETPTAVAAIRGTKLSVRVFPDGTTIIDSYSGQVEVTSKTGAPAVIVGYDKSLKEGGPPTTVGPEVAIRPDGSLVPRNTKSVETGILWGMAVGDRLQIIQPVSRLVYSTTLPYYVDLAQWSSDGRTLGVSYRDTLLEAETHTGHSYSYNIEWETNTVYTPAGFTEDTDRPSFSPTEGRMAWFQYGLAGVATSLCTAALDGSDPSCFEVDSSGYYQDTLAWSPDGQWLLGVQHSGSDRNVGYLYRVRPDGSDWQALTDVTQLGWEVDYCCYTWSPDGSRVVYALTEDQFNYEAPWQVWWMKADGSQAEMLRPEVPSQWTISFAWNSDGKLALALPDEVALLGPDGQRETLASQPGQYSQLRWSGSPSGWPLFYNHSSTEGTWFASILMAPDAEPVLGSVWKLIFSPDKRLGMYVDAMRFEDNTSQSSIYIFEMLPLWP